MPRNCYRGEASSVVFNVFDPMARHITLKALEQGIPDQVPELRYSFARRMWFYLPLMHAEDLATHERAVEEYDGMASDIESLIAQAAAPSTAPAAGARDEHHREAVRVVGANAEGAKQLAKVQVEFEKKHYDIIKQFGRYPHRNKALGREMTAEEQEYLDNGGETFSG